MKITRDNYEAYFLDYHEGQLSPEMVEEIMMFVEANPDLKNILDAFEQVMLVADEDIIFEKKSSLKKNQVYATAEINELNCEDYMLRETEGLLNDNELESLEEFIRINPHCDRDRKLFALSHLPLENDFVFTGKESLKKKAIPVGAINEDTFETFMARELEDDLNPDEKLQFSEFMFYNPHLEKDHKLYSHTILKAEKDIVFEDKNSLKQSIIPLRRIVYYVLSAAASLALIFSVYFLLDRNDIPRNIAEQGNVKNNTSKIIVEPDKAIPEKQVAADFNKPADAKIKNLRSKGKTKISTLPLNNTAAENQGNESFAFVDRHTIEPLHTLSARKVSTRSYVDPQFTFIRVSQMYMNKHLELYYNLKLAEQIQYAQINTKDKNPAKTILDAATGKADELLALNRIAPPREEKKNFSMWTFAELGVQTFNTITSGELELKLQKDDNGKVVAYGFESGLVDIEREVK